MIKGSVNKKKWRLVCQEPIVDFGGSRNGPLDYTHRDDHTPSAYVIWLLSSLKNKDRQQTGGNAKSSMQEQKLRQRLIDESSKTNTDRMTGQTAILLTENELQCTNHRVQLNWPIQLNWIQYSVFFTYTK